MQADQSCIKKNYKEQLIHAKPPNKQSFTVKWYFIKNKSKIKLILKKPKLVSESLQQ
jgi:hypothetical protein